MYLLDINSIHIFHECQKSDDKYTHSFCSIHSYKASFPKYVFSVLHHVEKNPEVPPLNANTRQLENFPFPKLGQTMLNSDFSKYEKVIGPTFH